MLVMLVVTRIVMRTPRWRPSKANLLVSGRRAALEMGALLLQWHRRATTSAVINRRVVFPIIVLGENSRVPSW
jgi:hypothetical protein